MAKPAVLQLCSFSDQDNADLEEQFDILRYDQTADQAGLLEREGSRIRGIANGGHVVVDRTLIKALPALEIIALFGAGYDAIDVEAATEAGVKVTNTPDVLSADVADVAVALFMGTEKEIVPAHEYVKSGDWARQGPYRLLSRIGGKTAGIVGLGRIGYEIARRLEVLGMNIKYWSRAAKPCPSDWEWIADPVELASKSQALFVALSLNSGTCKFVSRQIIEALGPDGVLVNISRSAIIDEEALLDSLESGKLGRAGIDVFEGEPHIDQRFCRLPNVLMHPHNGSGTVESRREMGELMIRNLTAHFNGLPVPTPVN